MFTFGRDKEIEVVLRRHGGLDKAAPLVNIVNAVHDLLEGTSQLDNVLDLISDAIINDRRDIWEAAGTWLLKLNKDFPESKELWSELAENGKAEVRFRVSAHLIEMPDDVAEKCYRLLKDDKSIKVREHISGNWDFRRNREKYT